ncbi:hypothetical protein FQA39_LY17091 [Lamprigera yunnana]|nr:hypothetical protein FQA39_LY17091 [Lamprigera yunnana]
MGPSGGKRPQWKLFDKINKILGSLPCNDASLIHESMEPIIYQQLCQPGTSSTTISSEDESGSQYDINVLQNVLDTNFQSESSKASTSSSIPSCATATPIATRKKRSRKYKPYEEIDRELLNEIKRSNDLTELEIKQNDALRNMTENNKVEKEFGYVFYDFDCQDTLTTYLPSYFYRVENMCKQCVTIIPDINQDCIYRGRPFDFPISFTIFQA